MNNASKVGKIATAITLVYTTLGLGAQAWANYQRQSVEGVSTLMFTLLLLTSSSWICYGAIRRDYNIVISNTFGAIFVVIILIQCWIYTL